RRSSRAAGRRGATCGATGVGLGVSLRLVELMNGRMDVPPAAGAGSPCAFTARLERRRPADDAPDETLIANVAQGRRVLVVDDNTTHAALVGQLLTHWGFHVDTAGDVDAAGDALRRPTPPFDLVLLDDSLDPTEHH